MEKQIITCDHCECEVPEGNDYFKVLTMYGAYHFCSHLCLIQNEIIVNALKK